VKPTDLEGDENVSALGGAGQGPWSTPCRVAVSHIIRRLHLRLLTVGPCRGHIQKAPALQPFQGWAWTSYRRPSGVTRCYILRPFRTGAGANQRRGLMNLRPTMQTKEAL